MPLKFVIWAAAFLCLVGCGSNGKSAAEDGGPASSDAMGDAGTGELGAGISLPLTFEEAVACSLDAECDPGQFCFLAACAAQCDSGKQCSSGVCDERGRCEPSEESGPAAQAYESGTTDRLANVSLIGVPPETVYVDAGQRTIALRVQTSAPVLAQGGLAYRVDSSAQPGSAAVVHVSASEVDHVITLATGKADPASAEPTVEYAYVTTAAGSFPITLVPRRAVEGTYESAVEIRGLGASVPLVFGIVTEPAGVTLEQASSAYLVLNSGAADLFGAASAGDAAPASDDDPEQRAVAGKLKYEPIIERWVARFDNGFSLASDEVFGELPAGQVRRQIRIEFSVDNDGRLDGALTDTWDGLYNQAADDHSETVSVVQLGGGFVATRVGAPPETSLLAAQLKVSVPSDPSVLAYSPATGCADLRSAQPDCSDTSTPEGATACAVALKGNVTGGGTISDVMAALLSGGDTEGTPAEGKTVAQFLEDCAGGDEPACIPSDDILCAIDAQVAAFQLSPPGSEADITARWTDFSDLLLQRIGGPELAAFYNDIDARRTWLTRGQFVDTAVTGSALKGLNEQLMRAWVRDVVDARVSALRTYIKPATFVFLSRPVDSPASTDQRDRLLISLVTSWSTAAQSLTLAADRWNEMYRLDSERAAKAAQVASRIRELYVAGAVIIKLHKDAGKAAQAAQIATGLEALLSSQSRLTQSFDSLLFGRDGEVVVSTSVNPEDKESGVLQKRHDAASKAVSNAATKVETILSDLLSDDIDDVALRSRLEKVIWDSEGTMVALCGQPIGCDVLAHTVVPDCEAPWEAGLCGFRVDKGPVEGRFLAHAEKAQRVLSTIEKDRKAFERCLASAERSSCSRPQVKDVFTEDATSPSDAAAAVADYRTAAQSYLGAVSEREAFTNATQALYASTDAFATQVAHWQDERELLSSSISERIKEIRAAGDTVLAEQAENVQAAIRERDRLAAIKVENVKNWNQIRLAGAQTDVSLRALAGAAKSTAAALNLKADFAEKLAEATKEGLPMAVGTSADPSFAARLTSLMAGLVASKALSAGAAASEAVGDGLEVARESAAAMRDATLENLSASADAAEQASQTQLDITALRDELKAAQLSVAEAKSDDLIAKLERSQAIAEAFERDLVELTDRRTGLVDRIVDGFGHDSEVLQAQLTMQKALQDYLFVVETARQERSALVGYRAHLAGYDNLVGGAQVFMTTAARLQEAERNLQQAKRKLNDWLVALEYFAVRPFFDERMAILLAKSSYELKKIEDHLADLEAACGGEVSTQSTNVSLRDELLGLKDSVVDTVTGRTLTPADRLRETLARGLVPVNQRVRYSASDSVGSLLQDKDVYSASFTLRLREFANLALTCSARVASISLRLVGEGLGSGQPVVTLLYDGSSQVYSCQAGINDYVDTFGQGSTTFGEVTAFEVTGRSASPVAGIAEMGDANNSLAGLPLASRYTLLIDPSLSANKGVDWSKLEDIEIGFTYTYQDPFPADSVCGKSR